MQSSVSLAEYFWELAVGEVPDQYQPVIAGRFVVRVPEDCPYREVAGKEAVLVTLDENNDEFILEVHDSMLDALRSLEIGHAPRVLN